MNIYAKSPLRYIPRGAQFILEDGNARRRASSYVWIKGISKKISGRMYAICHVAGNKDIEHAFDCNRCVLLIETRKHKRFWSRSNMGIYTMADWKKDKTLKVKIGQFIENPVYWQLLEGMPPAQTGKVFQVGEPYSHDPKTYEDLYSTFIMDDYNGQSLYKYVGNKPYNWKPSK